MTDDAAGAVGGSPQSFVGTADLADELGDAVESCDLQFRSFGRRVRVSGPIRTVRCRDDNVLLRDLLATPGSGGIVVVDGGGSLHSALIGDLIAGEIMGDLRAESRSDPETQEGPRSRPRR